mmetsp:Transcript_41739/g.91010  ORF Transcript_41739/g.91010 Transcript_41739/m.91010 type:complete len:167 (+) Transcript_41739:194-694(+)
MLGGDIWSGWAIATRLFGGWTFVTANACVVCGAFICTYEAVTKRSNGMLCCQFCCDGFCIAMLAWSAFFSLIGIIFEREGEDTRISAVALPMYLGEIGILVALIITGCQVKNLMNHERNAAFAGATGQVVGQPVGQVVGQPVGQVEVPHVSMSVPVVGNVVGAPQK